MRVDQSDSMELGVHQSLHETRHGSFSVLKNEWLHRFVFTTRAKAKRQVIRYIEGFYNHRRLHSALGYRPPWRYSTSPFQPKQPHRLRP